MAATKTTQSYKKEYVYTQADTAIDANATSTTTSLSIIGNYKLGVIVVGATGTHATHVVTLQTSLDDSVWVDTATTVTGEGRSTLDDVVGLFARAKVTTNEGAVSTVDITIISL
jgi:hypothetical protein